ncbi:MAG: histidinol-phosphatase [Clostridiales bacterium]|jgi:histidinol-phosphatase (PHP family)|nr:histidinol-phosphatase [Clostridiales bacterium]
MIQSNLHTHTLFCDGKNTPEEMVEAAIGLGFRSLGFSGHGYADCDPGFCGTPLEAMPAYRDAVRALQAQYEGLIDVFLGIENDAAYMHPASDYDYTIGSVHYIPVGGEYHCADATPQKFERSLARAFGGDGMKMAKAYFETVCAFASAPSRPADIMGHMDLVRRFNAGGRRYFDESSPAYRAMATEALEAVVRSGMFLEVNTSLIAKGASDEPYPSVFLLRRAKEMGARVVVNSDAHAAKNLNFGFDRMEELLSRIGFTEIWELTKAGFEPQPLPDFC